MPPQPNASSPKVRIRMYRQGLGDCFLVTFNPGPDETHMLIDCGSLGATTTDVSTAEVVAHIRQSTNNHLQLLVATHEHHDHLSGFRHFKTEPKIKVDHVWLGWTEKPEDELARQIVKYRNDLGAAVAAAARALASDTDDRQSKSLGLAIQDVLGFAGDPQALGAGKFSETVDEAMDFIRTGLGIEPAYLQPGGEAIEPDWAPGFRFYVLGPPRSKAALQNLGEHGSSELYHVSSGLAVAAALAAGADVDDEQSESEMPFDARFHLQPDDSLMAASSPNYFDPNLAWRKVDRDWLHATADLALQLDSLTNNTSLALAIERISDGKVLLFAADAQQGNWLSWHDANLKWTVKGRSNREIRASDLLKRTVFYKVGHHGSHNATASEKGLELMELENELTAFIPVDRSVALKKHPKDSWQMPAVALYRRLLEKCQGRVARSDLGWADDATNAADRKTEKQFTGLANHQTWREWKKSQQRANLLPPEKLFIELVL
jgi:hypothetical protein